MDPPAGEMLADAVGLEPTKTRNQSPVGLPIPPRIIVGDPTGNRTPIFR